MNTRIGRNEQHEIGQYLRETAVRNWELARRLDPRPKEDAVVAGQLAHAQEIIVALLAAKDARIADLEKQVADRDATHAAKLSPADEAAADYLIELAAENEAQQAAPTPAAPAPDPADAVTFDVPTPAPTATPAAQ